MRRSKIRLRCFLKNVAIFLRFSNIPRHSFDTSWQFLRISSKLSRCVPTWQSMQHSRFCPPLFAVAWKWDLLYPPHFRCTQRDGWQVVHENVPAPAVWLHMGQIVVFALLSFYHIKIGYYTNIVFDRFYQKLGFATSLSLHPHHQSHSEPRFFPGIMPILALVVSRNLKLFMSRKRD